MVRRVVRGSEAGGRRQWDAHSKATITAGLTALLAGLDLRLGHEWTPCSVELPAGAHRPDLVFMSPVGVAVHVEVQQEPDPDMAARMAEYAVRMARTSFARPLTDLVQIVVQVTGAPMAVDFRLGRLSNRVHLVHVPTMSWDRYRVSSPLAPFALVSGGDRLVGPVVGAIAGTSDADLRSAMAMMALYLAPELTDTLVAAIRRVGMTDIIEAVERTEFGRGLIARGRQEGRQEGELHALAELLRARFPGASRPAVDHTASILLVEHGDAAIRVALALESLPD
jgi:hypothetical protein